MIKSKVILHCLTVVLLIVQTTNSTELKISNISNGIPGSTRTFSILADSVDSEIEGYSILLALNQKDYGFISATPSSDIANCRWDYFNYRLLSRDSIQQYDIGNNTDLLLVTGFKGNLGMDFPSCGISGKSGNLFDLTLTFVSESYNRPVRCTTMPMRFYWRDCDDNVLYSSNSDNINRVSTLYETSFDTTVSSQSSPGFGPPDYDCNTLENPNYINNITAINGFIDFPCVDTVGNLVGDLNLNGIPNEMADAVRFMEYFRFGLGILCSGITNCIPDAVISQSDVNKDDLTLSVADLVFQLLIIIGDEEPRLKPSPSHENVSDNSVNVIMNESNGSTVIELNTNVNISAVYIRLTNDNNEDFEISEHVINTENEFQLGNIKKEATILLVDITDNLVLESGRHRLIELEGSGYNISHVEIVDEYANQLRIITDEFSAPENFTLKQNYPNPFNLSTSIEFTLNSKSDVVLAIYNSIGRKVKSIIDKTLPAGSFTVEWNGTNDAGDIVSSGIYFYKIEAGQISTSRSMVLLK